jgi:hypothetical protein
LPPDDLVLSPIVGKLLLLAHGPLEHKRGEDASATNAYALAGENFFAHPDGDHPKFRVGPTASRVLVRLSAENMNEQQFVFRIDRNENGSISAITQVTL